MCRHKQRLDGWFESEQAGYQPNTQFNATMWVNNWMSECMNAWRNQGITQVGTSARIRTYQEVIIETAMLVVMHQGWEVSRKVLLPSHRLTLHDTTMTHQHVSHLDHWCHMYAAAKTQRLWKQKQNYVTWQATQCMPADQVVGCLHCNMLQQYKTCWCTKRSWTEHGSRSDWSVMTLQCVDGHWSQCSNRQSWSFSSFVIGVWCMTALLQLAEPAILSLQLTIEVLITMQSMAEHDSHMWPWQMRETSL